MQCIPHTHTHTHTHLAGARGHVDVKGVDLVGLKGVLLQVLEHALRGVLHDALSL
jgi:hypothetical protein